jgi:hypothetical protein
VILESPLLAAPLEKWEAWLRELDALPAPQAQDEAVVFGKKHAQAVIRCKRSQPSLRIITPYPA